MKLLEGKTAVVTGGASGIGLASARAYADAGARVLISDVNETLGREMATAHGFDWLAADAGSSTDWSRLGAFIDETLGRLDIAHLNTGVATGEGDVTKISDGQFERALSTNVLSALYGVRETAPRIIAAGGGAIVVTASLAGLMDFTPDPVYTLSKHALVGFVRAAAPQLIAAGVTLNCVCPNVTATPAVGPLEVWQGAGFDVLEPEQVADAALGCVLGAETGQAIVIQPGRPPLPFAFRNIPGPRPVHKAEVDA